MFKLYKTAIIYASEKGHTEIVKLLIEQEGIDTNDEDVYFFYSTFVSII